MWKSQHRYSILFFSFLFPPTFFPYFIYPNFLPLLFVSWFPRRGYCARSKLSCISSVNPEKPSVFPVIIHQCVWTTIAFSILEALMQSGNLKHPTFYLKKIIPLCLFLTEIHYIKQKNSFSKKCKNGREQTNLQKKGGLKNRKLLSKLYRENRKNTVFPRFSVTGTISWEKLISTFFFFL